MSAGRKSGGRNRTSSREQSTKIAFCGLIVGVAVVLMLAGGIIPIATYCTPMLAGILLLPVLLEFGQKAALTAYAATALISLILGIDKEASFFFLFLGYYPIVKWQLDRRIRSKPPRLLAKLCIYNLSVALMYALLGLVLNMEAIVAEFSGMGTGLLAAFVVLFNICMLMYDRLLMPLVFLYANRIRPKLRFLRQ